MKTLRVAVTGGIGSGKSTVSRLLAERGAVVVDADAIARDVVAKGTPGLDALTREFGRSILLEDGSLDRPAMAYAAFTNPDARRRLEAIVHPLVREESERRLTGVPTGGVAVYDVPLLAEAGPDGRDAFDVVVVVRADPEVRVARLVDRGLNEDDARRRIEAQASDAEREALADVVVDNSGPVESLAGPVDALWRRLDDAAQAVS